MTRVWSANPVRMFPAAFDTFRKLLKTTGQNQAAFAVAEGQDPEEFHFAAVWAAIRAGCCSRATKCCASSCWHSIASRPRSSRYSVAANVSPCRGV